MLRTKKCDTCLYCARDIQIDMGCTMDICNIAEVNLGCYSGIMCPEWKAIRNKEKILNDCPFYKKLPNSKKILNSFEKEKFINWIKDNHLLN